MACFSRYSDVKSIRRFDRDLIRVQPGLASGSDRIARTSATTAAITSPVPIEGLHPGQAAQFIRATGSGLPIPF